MGTGDVKEGNFILVNICTVSEFQKFLTKSGNTGRGKRLGRMRGFVVVQVCFCILS